VTDYLVLAAELSEQAPSQARLLRHVLVNPNQTVPEITEALDLTEGNFRQLVGKLRDRGVEIVPKRVLTDPTDQRSAVYRWSIKGSDDLEHWAGERQGALMTAWSRVERMMIRHLRGIEELDVEERGIIIGKLLAVSEDIARVDVYAQKRVEEARAAAAVQEAEAVEALA